MHIENIISECAETTVSKGFDTKNYPAQVLLVITEVTEALENLWPFDRHLHHLVDGAINLGKHIERERIDKRWSADWGWKLGEGTMENLLEELSDVCIRIFSLIGANGHTEAFVGSMRSKMNKNKLRPHMHGKKN